MNILIKGGTVVNNGTREMADIIIEDDRVKNIIKEGISTQSADSFDCVINATDCIVMPGVIDAHVHFREPGLTHKADMETESRAAAYGGVTSVFEMPNTKPQTTTLEALAEKEEIAKEKMHVNYAFFPGATNDNVEELKKLDIHRIPGIKLFMGSSTGNMLVDKENALDAIFELAKEMNLPLMTHCEDTEIINDNMERLKKVLHTDDPDITCHPQIRSSKACYKSSMLAARLAKKHGTRLHIAHISTEDELPLLTEENVTGEVTVSHLMFSECDYETLGARIKCNPAIKSSADMYALQDALKLNMRLQEVDRKHRLHGVCTIGTDHAPHDISEKIGGSAKAMSGMPMIQFSLVSILSLVDKEIITLEQLVTLMCHNPARLFSVDNRGFLAPGYKADIVIVKREEKPWTVTKECIQSKCGWSPLEGREFNWQVKQTIVNGTVVYDNGTFNSSNLGEHLSFRGRE